MGLAESLGEVGPVSQVPLDRELRKEYKELDEEEEWQLIHDENTVQNLQLQTKSALEYSLVTTAWEVCRNQIEHDNT